MWKLLPVGFRNRNYQVEKPVQNFEPKGAKKSFFEPF